MPTGAAEKVILLRFDESSKPGHPVWMVSRGEVDPDGTIVRRDTCNVFAPDEREAARADAWKRAAWDDTRVLEV